MSIRVTLVTVLLAFVSASAVAQPGKEDKPKIPTWARDARWYHINVARFYNGDRSNDPPGAVPMSAVTPTADASPQDLADRQYGGDLRGLEHTLRHLKSFGINALYLAPIFTKDLRHVDDRFGIKPGPSTNADETGKSDDEAFSPSDRVFLRFLRTAHRQEVHVIVDVGPLRDAEALLKVTQRWLDPDGDGDPSDGVDGWVLHVGKEDGPLLGKRLREQVKKINAQALLVAHPEDPMHERVQGDWFDVEVSYEAGLAIRRFFSGTDKAYTLEKFFDDLGSIRKRHGLDRCLATLSAVSGPKVGRLLSGLVPSSAPATGETASKPSPRPNDEARDRWRLAEVFHHFFLGAPVTYYGDEVGMYGPAGPAACLPMWWDQAKALGAGPADYREDFLTLIRLLNIRRDKKDPLRHGDFRTVLLDEERKILAFARPLPPDEVILLMNYGSEKQEVTLPAGRPGQMIGLLAPQLRISPGAAGLMTGGSRQESDPSGRISAWVKPMSVRIVLVEEKEGR